MKILLIVSFWALFLLARSQDDLVVIREDEGMIRPRATRFRRELSTWNTFTNWTSCMKEDVWIWSGATCIDYTSSEKSMSQYYTWKTSTLSSTYCYNYSDGAKNFPASKVTLRHQESGGSIEPGVYCDWKYDTQRKYVYKVTIKKSSDQNQEFKITLRGSKGESLTFIDEDFNKTSSSFTFYNAVTIEVEAMQKVGGTVSVYE